MKMEHKKKLSHKYMEHMRNQLEYLNSITTLSEDDRQRETSTFHDMLVVWSICELIFITGSASDVVIKDFLEWINIIDPGEIFFGHHHLYSSIMVTGQVVSMSFFSSCIVLLLQRNLRQKRPRSYLPLIC